jgi:hypothetical protein
MALVVGMKESILVIPGIKPLLLLGFGMILLLPPVMRGGDETHTH